MTMATIWFDSATDDILNHLIDPSADTFYGMLVTDSYTPVSSHSKRSDVTNEVSGTGYTAGGFAVTLTLAKDGTNHWETISIADVTLSGATITARGIVVYKHRGGASSADNLLFSATFGADKTATAGNFTSHQSTPIKFTSNNHS